MAKKRRAPRTSGPESRTGDGRTQLTINSWEDVADSGDEFQISRDKVLLEEEPTRKRRRKLNEEYQELVPSDEEILDLPSSDEDENFNDYTGQASDDASSISQQQDEEEVEEAWGTSRQDYYNADAIETEADALEEEEEALRLQQKQLQGMTEADFGFDENEWLANGADKDDEAAQLEELLPQIEIADDMSTEERTRILTSRYPEFKALANEFTTLQAQHEEFSSKAQLWAATVEPFSTETIVPGTVLKWRVLSAYLGVLSMYFVVLTSGSTDSTGKCTTLSPSEMRKHPIMETIFQARTQWEMIRNLDLSDLTSNNGHEHEDSMEVQQIATDGLQEFPQQAKHKRPRMSKAEARAVKAKNLAETERATRLQKTKDELAQLALSAAKPATTKNIHPARFTENESDFGEAPVTDDRLQDRRKKSLAFYTSQIAAKTNKRTNASKSAGGDDDVPYQERFRDRIARLNAEAHARGQGKRDELGGGGSDEEDTRIAAEARNQDDGEDYYQTIASKTQKKKDTKAARAVAMKEAASQGARIREVESLGADGKRAITYAIEKNKGLTPKRKKENRNPRVKKRLKYEDKMKKLGSIRQLYKGGEGKGGYGGETTGIKSGIVRSRKL